jgi:hypothetical protein
MDSSLSGNTMLSSLSSTTSSLSSSPSLELDLGTGASSVSSITNEIMDTTTTTGKGIIEWITSQSLSFYVIVFVILTIFGINLLLILGKFTNVLSDYTRPILKVFGIETSKTVKSVIHGSAEGTKKIADVVDTSVSKSLTGLEKALQHSSFNSQQSLTNPEPDDVGSSQQKRKMTNKGGYCYIGEDRGFRSCVNVGVADKCLSGEIFPSKEICVNPSLRM